MLWLVDWEFYSLVALSILSGNTDHLCFTLNVRQLSLFDYKMRLEVIATWIRTSYRMPLFLGTPIPHEKTQGLCQGTGNWDTPNAISRLLAFIIQASLLPTNHSFSNPASYLHAIFFFRTEQSWNYWGWISRLEWGRAANWEVNSHFRVILKLDTRVCQSLCPQKFFPWGYGRWGEEKKILRCPWKEWTTL